MTKLNPTLQADFLPAEPQGKPFQMDFIKYTAYKNKDDIKSSKSERHIYKEDIDLTNIQNMV